MNRSTGFFDERQKEILAGDILEFWWNPFLNQPSVLGKLCGVVVWDSEEGIWAVEYKHKEQTRRLALEFAIDEEAIIQEGQLTLF